MNGTPWGIMMEESVCSYIILFTLPDNQGKIGITTDGNVEFEGNSRNVSKESKTWWETTAICAAILMNASQIKNNGLERIKKRLAFRPIEKIYDLLVKNEYEAAKCVAKAVMEDK